MLSVLNDDFKFSVLYKSSFPFQGEGYDFMDAEGRATSGTVAEDSVMNSLFIPSPPRGRLGWGDNL